MPHLVVLQPDWEQIEGRSAPKGRGSDPKYQRELCSICGRWCVVELESCRLARLLGDDAHLCQDCFERWVP
jgi:hypothetical protein